VIAVARVLTACALLAVFGWSLAVLSVYLFGRVDEARPVDAIVVLGAAQYDGRPSPVLGARLDHAIDLYGRGYADRLILTGGVGVGDTVSEAAVGQRYAMRAGIDGEAILLERSGLSSEESMVAVTRLMRSHELGSAVLVSDPFHMLRLKLLSRQVGVRGFTSPTRTSPISRNPELERRHVLRESVSLPFTLLRAVF
jgi:uncharacterized SAM-binding protein YcdF (DUF218 family)